MNDASPLHRAERLLSQIQSECPCTYVLQWKGSKIPRGATIDGTPIAWTQHGIVYGEARKILGYYRRTKEWGGESGDEHEMVIFTSSPAVIVAPDGLRDRPIGPEEEG